LSEARLGARLIAADLNPLGIDVNCLPVADVPVAGANPAKHDLSAGYSARDYAVRDPRAAAILKAIDEAHPRPKTAVGPN